MERGGSVFDVRDEGPLASEPIVLLHGFPGSFVRSGQALRSWYMGFFQLPFLPELAASSDRFATALRKGGMTEEDVARVRHHGERPHDAGVERRRRRARVRSEGTSPGR